VRFLICGLGSMGKRRLRNLRALGYEDIVGFDIRKDRRIEAEKYIVGATYEFDLTRVDAAIICVPPRFHTQYAEACVDAGVPCFMELDVYDFGIGKLADLAEEKDVLVAPSDTLRNYSDVRRMKEMLDKETYGKPWAFVGHTGQYLLDWHPWEGLNFYMSDKLTGGAIEVASFDLIYLTWLFGFPVVCTKTVDKVSDINADIFDIMSMQMKFANGVRGNITTDVISRMNTRILRIFCRDAVISWDWGVGLTISRDRPKLFEVFPATEHIVRQGYSEKIKEEPYIAEISNFIDAINGKKSYPYTLREVERRLKLLWDGIKV